MNLVTWNVNSLKARIDRVRRWVEANEPDVLCLQETKLDDDAFPSAAFGELGYESVHHGAGRWNGVAILSRVGLENPRRGFVDDPTLEGECRLVAATCAGVRVLSVYVPNGRIVGSPFYLEKLAWLGRLHNELESSCVGEQAVAVCGDFNVAPTDRDVWDVSSFDGATHVTPAEREAVDRLISWGLRDVVREQHPDEVGPFTWWDYRAGAFHKGEGMRIDLVLCTPALADAVTGARVDRNERKKGVSTIAPSDHAPVVVDFELTLPQTFAEAERA